MGSSSYVVFHFLDECGHIELAVPAASNEIVLSRYTAALLWINPFQYQRPKWPLINLRASIANLLGEGG